MDSNLLDTTSCSFCAKLAPDVSRLIAGPGVYICEVCVDKCVTILEAPKSETTNERVVIWSEMNDAELLNHLNRMNNAAGQVDRSMRDLVGELRSRSTPWARIGESLGITRQSAWGRFSDEP
jgi:hypothetical protein